MKEAIARSCLWFFGTIIFVWFLAPSFIQGDSPGLQVLKLFIAGFVVAGAIFCKEWYEMERAKRINGAEQKPSSDKSVTED